MIDQIKILASLGKVQFRIFEDGRHECRFEAEFDGQRVLIAHQRDSLERALDEVFVAAVNEGYVEVVKMSPLNPIGIDASGNLINSEGRVITKTLTDSIRTKDGAA